MHKKTSDISYGWQKEAESYFNNTPSPKLWFELMSWITTFSTLKYFADRTHSFYITALYWISYAVLFNHVEKTIWTRKFQKYLPSKFAEKTTKTITYIISVLLVALMYWLIINIYPPNSGLQRL